MQLTYVYIYVYIIMCIQMYQEKVFSSEIAGWVLFFISSHLSTSFASGRVLNLRPTQISKGSHSENQRYS